MKLDFYWFDKILHEVIASILREITEEKEPELLVRMVAQSLAPFEVFSSKNKGDPYTYTLISRDKRKRKGGEKQLRKLNDDPHTLQKKCDESGTTLKKDK